MDDIIRCEFCGHSLCAGKHEDTASEASVEPAPPTPKAKPKPKPKPKPSAGSTAEFRRKVRPRMLWYKNVREAARCHMLSALPGISTVRAMAILRVFPTFQDLMEASELQIACVPVKNSELGVDLASIIFQVLH